MATKRRPKSKIKVRESVFQKNLLKALKLSGYLAYKQNVISGFFGEVWLSSGIPAGASDLIVLGKPGIVLFVELKSSTGFQRETQVKFQQEVEKRGGVYLLLSARDSLQSNLDMIRLAIEKKRDSLAREFAFKLK